MNIGKSFTYIFEDKEWAKKILLGIVISIIPIVNFAWIGYMVKIMRNVYDGAAVLLPDWSDFGDKFVKGLIVAIASFIYSLPAWIISVPAFFILLLPAMSGDQDTVNAMAGVMGGTTLLFACCIFTYLLVLTFIFPALYANFSRKYTFGSCFELGVIFKLIGANLGNYLVAWIVWIIAAVVIGFVIGVVTALIGWIPCIGWLITLILSGFTGVWISTVFAYLFGEVGKDEMSAVANP